MGNFFKKKPDCFLKTTRQNKKTNINYNSVIHYSKQSNTSFKSA